MRVAYFALGLFFAGWAVWSIIRFLFLPPSSTGDHAGWKWILSIFIEGLIASFFFSLSRGNRQQ
jgi:hypothetical protein